MENEDLMELNDAKREAYNNGWNDCVDKVCEYLQDSLHLGHGLINALRRAMARNYE